MKPTLVDAQIAKSQLQRFEIAMTSRDFESQGPCEIATNRIAVIRIAAMSDRYQVGLAKKNTHTHKHTFCGIPPECSGDFVYVFFLPQKE